MSPWSLFVQLVWQQMLLNETGRNSAVQLNVFQIWFLCIHTSKFIAVPLTWKWWLWLINCNNFHVKYLQASTQAQHDPRVDGSHADVPPGPQVDDYTHDVMSIEQVHHVEHLRWIHRDIQSHLLLFLASFKLLDTHFSIVELAGCVKTSSGCRSRQVVTSGDCVCHSPMKLAHSISVTADAG